MVAAEIEEALWQVDRLIAEGAPYEEVMAALDECARIPGADAVMPGIGQRRLCAVGVYERGEEEREQEMIAFLQLDQPLIYRTSSVVAACANAGSKRLVETYVVPLVRELQAAIAAGDDSSDVLEKELRVALQVCARLGIGVD